VVPIVANTETEPVPISSDQLRALWAGFETGFLTVADPKVFLDDLLVAATIIPPWLLSLYDADSTSDALAAVWHAIHEREVDVRPVSTESLILGFLYLRFLRGDLTLRELLLQTGRWTDGTNYGHPQCETLYSLLTDLESGVDARTVTEGAAALLVHHEAAARRVLSTLPLPTERLPT
jgi:hypothetical protein